MQIMDTEISPMNVSRGAKRKKKVEGKQYNPCVSSVVPHTYTATHTFTLGADQYNRIVIAPAINQLHQIN